MLSSVPIPGNSWPHDMVLTIEDDSQTLLELLWVREAWRLQPAGDDLAPLLSVTPVGADNAAVPVGKLRSGRKPGLRSGRRASSTRGRFAMQPFSSNFLEPRSEQSNVPFYCRSSSVRVGVMPSAMMLSPTNTWSGIKLSSAPSLTLATRP